MIDLKDFLKYVDTSQLHEKICQFRDLDFKRISYEEIQNAISKVINFDTPYENISILTPVNVSYPIGTRFYRVRTIPGSDIVLPLSDRDLPLKTMCKLSDCWEPPENIVRSGRLNRDNEALLYTSPQAPVAVEEMKIPNNELFSLIVYEATEKINVTKIGSVPNIEGLNQDEMLKVRVIQDFLRHEFTRDVGSGTEYLYRISESITKDYFDLPPDFQDAWCYHRLQKRDLSTYAFVKKKV
jgi:hypothetical protein